MLYVGLIRNGDEECMYLSSVAADDDHDEFEKNARFIEFTSKHAKDGDVIAQRAELQLLSNILTDGGAIVTVETL